MKETTHDRDELKELYTMIATAPQTFLSCSDKTRICLGVHDYKPNKVKGVKIRNGKPEHNTLFFKDSSFRQSELDTVVPPICRKQGMSLFRFIAPCCWSIVALI